MAARPLQPPLAALHRRALRILEVDPACLSRISWHNTGEPYFGRRAANRFDDPEPDEGKRYGTCYLGLSLIVAFAESVLHEAVPSEDGFEVAQAQLEGRYALRFQGAPLRLADLTGPALAVLGGNGEISGTTDYALTQQWSHAVCTHPAHVDGFLYMSRLITNGYAVVLFEREAANPLPLTLGSQVKLPHHVDFKETMEALNVKVSS